jgi:HK97 family phage prohead protease
MRIRIVPFTVTRAVSEEGEFEGHASVFGVEDSYETIFDKGCFARTLKHQHNEIPISHHHDAKVGIGMAHATEDKKGLLLDPGRLNIKRSQDANEVFAGLPHEGEPATGYYSQMSHGFDPIVIEKGKDNKIHFREVKLYEVALVMRNFASTPGADVAKVRSNLIAVQKALREDRVDDLNGLFTRFANSLEAFVLGGEVPETSGGEPRKYDSAEGSSRKVSESGIDTPGVLSAIQETEALFRDIVGSSIDTRREEDSPDYFSSLSTEHEIVVSLRKELRAIGEDLRTKKKE